MYHVNANVWNDRNTHLWKKILWAEEKMFPQECRFRCVGQECLLKACWQEEVMSCTVLTCGSVMWCPAGWHIFLGITREVFTSLEIIICRHNAGLNRASQSEQDRIAFFHIRSTYSIQQQSYCSFNSQSPADYFSCPVPNNWLTEKLEYSHPYDLWKFASLNLELDSGSWDFFSIHLVTTGTVQCLQLDTLSHKCGFTVSHCKTLWALCDVHSRCVNITL